MPREGSKTITVSEEKHGEAKRISKKLGITLKEYIEKIIGIQPEIIPNSQFNNLEQEVPQVDSR